MTQQDNSRQQLIQGLQEDLAREYKAIIQYVVYSQAISEPQYMNIAQELEKHAHEELDHAIRIARQLDYFGEYPTITPSAVARSIWCSCSWRMISCSSSASANSPNALAC